MIHTGSGVYKFYEMLLKGGGVRLLFPTFCGLYANNVARELDLKLKDPSGSLRF